MLCEMSGDVRRYRVILVKLVVTESLSDHNELAKELTRYWIKAC